MAIPASSRSPWPCWSTSVTCAMCRSIPSPRAQRPGSSCARMIPRIPASRTCTAVPKGLARAACRMRRGSRSVAAARPQRGFTYIGLLAVIVLIGYFLAVAGEVVATSAQHERETELLFIGHEYRHAIARFFRQNHRYPQTLDELVQADQNGPLPAHFLRRLYRDPMTRDTDWVLVPAPGGGFTGVASASTGTPLKSAGFDDEDIDFDKADSYSKWVFSYDPALMQLRRQQSPGGAPLPVH